MDFALNDEQKMLVDSVSRFVKGSYDMETRRKIIKNENSFNQDVWNQFVELGWTMLPFSEEDGGLGGSLVETMLLVEEFGKGLVVEPFIDTVVTGGGFLKRANADQKAKWLAPLIEGSLQVAFAAQEYEQVFDLTQTETSATAEGAGFVLNGVKSCVSNGDKADLFVVLARSAGAAGSRNGLSLFLVDAKSEGVSVKAHRTIDGHTAAQVTFNNVFVGAEGVLGEAGNAIELAETVIEETILALGAEAVGALSVLLYDTIEYTKTRKQFGIAISNFQALQHRMADMFIGLEQSKSLLLAATLKTVEGHSDAKVAVHALKAQIGRAGRKIGQEAVQLHGGMGMTDELNIGHFFKRITAIDGMFGNSDRHLATIAAQVA